MAYEVEIKARAYPELKEVLDRFCSAEGHAVDKDDIYFAFSTLLRNNLHTISYTHLKYTIWEFPSRLNVKESD